ncbi:MAG: hypothetical protein H0X33_14550 [Taibaiella sp.]|nr:hypothetical protein [Taibaiella sp.]
MNSAFAQIFLAIQSRIQAQVPEIKHIDQDLLQLHFETRPAISFPAVLIDFSNWSFTDYGENAQDAEGDVTITLVRDVYSNTTQYTPEQWKEAALAFYDTEFSLHAALQGWCPGVAKCGSMSRSNVATVNQAVGLRVRRITYRLAFNDFSTQNVELEHAAVPVISASFH